MKNTAKKYLDIIRRAKANNQSLYAFCKDNNLSPSIISNYVLRLNKRNKLSKDEEQVLIEYSKLTCQNSSKTKYTCESKINRDNIGKIINYEYIIRTKGGPVIQGILSREEMNTIHRLYSYYGDSLTQRVISRYFSDISLITFKRILNTFNITKASAPFAPHMIEECSEQELREIQLREKENSFLRKAEEDNIKNNEKLLNKYAQENIDLKKKLASIESLNITVNGRIDTYKLPEIEPLNQGINLYLSDIHLGAKVVSGTLYKENVNYGLEEAKRRLSESLNRMSSFGDMDFINVVLLGDNVDCCGFEGLTARRDHVMPNNLDPRQQAEQFIELMMWFTQALYKFTNKIRIYSVPCGNHDGIFGRMIVKTLFAGLKATNPEIETTLWEEFFGYFKVGSHTVVCTHGKDDLFCKRGLPLELNDKTKAMIYEYLDDRKLHGDNIHIIKGDLHSSNMSSCKRFDYRNVLSLFGASDYSNLNFTRNAYGMSYDFFINDNIIRGTFENLLIHFLDFLIYLF